MPTLDSYNRKKMKRGRNASITIMRSGQFGFFFCDDQPHFGRYNPSPQGDSSDRSLPGPWADRQPAPLRALLILSALGHFGPWPSTPTVLLHLGLIPLVRVPHG
jgi:hypothetical protein